MTTHTTTLQAEKPLKRTIQITGQLVHDVDDHVHVANRGRITLTSFVSEAIREKLDRIYGGDANQQ